MSVSESERLDAVAALVDLDGSQLDLDTICRTAATLFDMPIALSTLVDRSTVWIKGRFGTRDISVPREHAFCDRTIALKHDDALVVNDLLAHEHFAESALVTGDPKARFYAGVPITTESGANVGTLCLIDRVPRPDFGPAESDLLKDFGRILAGQLRVHAADQKRLNEQNERAAIESGLRQREAALQTATNTQRLAETTASFGQWRLGTDMMIYWSWGMASIFGRLRPEDGLLPFETHLTYYHPDDQDACRQRVAKALADGPAATAGGYSSKARVVRPDGEIRDVMIQGMIERDADGSPTIYGVLLDISDLARSERRTRENVEMLRTTLENMDQGLIMLDADERVRIHNGRVAALFELPDTVLKTGAHFADIRQFLRSRGDHFVIDGDGSTYAETGCIEKEPTTYEITRSSGLTIEVHAEPLEGGGVVRTYTDVTDRRRIERRIQDSEKRYRRMAVHDALTALPNRTFFWDRLRQDLVNAQRFKGKVAVLACDLDRFKIVNDTLGHPAGDELLQVVAKRFRTVVRAGDTIARLGGDEFAIILTRADQADELHSIAERLISVIGQPVEIENQRIRVGLSIGIAVAPDDGVDADTLFRNADIALYRAKSEGRNTHRSFEGGMDKLLAERTALEGDMREAIQQGAFKNFYQPIVRIADQAIVGFEALLRWQHPTRGSIPPTTFIPLAEEIGLIGTMGEAALRDACLEAAGWPNNLRIAVNVSPTQFKQPDQLKNSVVMALATSGLSADRLELEITESVLAQDAEAAIACLNSLRALGVRIALDDFGTGYSSLNYLRRFPFSKIKIDRTFVASIGEPNTAAIVRAVVGLAGRVDADVTAEGIETPEQLAHVTLEGCTQAQGFLFSHPVSDVEAARMIRNRAALDAA